MNKLILTLLLSSIAALASGKPTAVPTPQCNAQRNRTVIEANGFQSGAYAQSNPGNNKSDNHLPSWKSDVNSDYNYSFTRQTLSLTYTYLYNDLSTNGLSFSYNFFPCEHFGFGPIFSYTRRSASSPMLSDALVSDVYHSIKHYTYKNANIMIGVDAMVPYINNKHCLFGSTFALGYQYLKSERTGCKVTENNFFLTYSPVHVSVGKVFRFEAEPYIGTNSQWTFIGGIKAGLAVAF